MSNNSYDIGWFVDLTVVYILFSLILFNISPVGWYSREYFFGVLLLGIIASIIYDYIKGLYIYVSLIPYRKRRGVLEAVKTFIENSTSLIEYALIITIYNIVFISLVFYIGLGYSKMSHEFVNFYVNVLNISAFLSSIVIEMIFLPYIVLNKIGRASSLLKAKRFLSSIVLPWIILSFLTTTVIDGVIYFITNSEKALYPCFACTYGSLGEILTWTPTYGSFLSPLVIAYYTRSLLEREKRRI